MRARQACRLALAVVLTAQCGGEAPQNPTPTPTPSPPQDTWYIYPVTCSAGCTGLTNVEIDRTTTPPRVRLPVGALTSLRAKAFVGCGSTETVLFVSHWVASDPFVIGLEPSSTESAIVTALAPGVSRITAQRTLQDGNESVVGLSDPLRTDAACAPQAEFVFEVIP